MTKLGDSAQAGKLVLGTSPAARVAGAKPVSGGAAVLQQRQRTARTAAPAVVSIPRRRFTEPTSREKLR